MVSQTSTRQVVFTHTRGSERITAGKLIEALEAALVWLRGQDQNALVDWEVVRVGVGNPLRLVFSSTSANGEIAERLRNLNSLQKRRAPRIGPRLTDEDIDGTRRLAALMGDEIKAVRISSPGEPTVQLTRELVERVEEIAKSTRAAYYEWGTIRGRMDQVTVGTHPRFRIRHQLTNDEIACTFDRETLGDVKNALPARVEVYGRIRVDRFDRPRAIEVETFRVLTDESCPFNELPPVNITDGMDSSEFVGRLRSAS